MSTKDEYEFFKKRQQTFVNNNSLSDNGNQYSYFNLNKNCSNLFFVQSQSKSNNDKFCYKKKTRNIWAAATIKISDSTVYDNNKKEERFQSWNKSSRISNNNLTLNDEDERLWKKKDGPSEDINKSTLSLHISAYENSFETLASDLFEDKNNESLRKESFSLNKKIINTKQVFTAPKFIIQNPFEFPRQQNDKVPAEPEVSQFKASQKLSNPNEASSNNTRQQQGNEPVVDHTVQSQHQHPSPESLLDIDSIELHRKRREVLQKFPYFFVAFLGNQGSGKAEVRRACFQQTSITNKDVTLPLDAKSIVVQEHRIDLIAIKKVNEFATQAASCSYLNALILFYNITNLEHFNSVHQKWIPAIKRLYPTTPFIICATGIEARENSSRRTNVSAQFKKILGGSESPLKTANSAEDLFSMSSNKKNHFEKFVTKEMGEALAKEVGATSFIEVSTVNFENISKLMDLMFDVILESETAKMSLHSTRIGRPRPDETCIVT